MPATLALPHIFDDGEYDALLAVIDEVSSKHPDGAPSSADRQAVARLAMHVIRRDGLNPDSLLARTLAELGRRKLDFMRHDTVSDTRAASD